MTKKKIFDINQGTSVTRTKGTLQMYAEIENKKLRQRPIDVKYLRGSDGATTSIFPTIFLKINELKETKTVN